LRFDFYSSSERVWQMRLGIELALLELPIGLCKLLETANIKLAKPEGFSARVTSPVGISS
jgi:hypothetical protein